MDFWEWTELTFKLFLSFIATIGLVVGFFWLAGTFGWINSTPDEKQILLEENQKQAIKKCTESGGIVIYDYSNKIDECRI